MMNENPQYDEIDADSVVIIDGDGGGGGGEQFTNENNKIGVYFSCVVTQFLGIVDGKGLYFNSLIGLTIAAMCLSIYLQIVQFFVVFAEDVIFYLNILAVIGHLSTTLISAVVIFELMLSKNGDISFRNILLRMFIVLLVAQLFVFSFFAYVTLHGLITSILYDNQALTFKLTLVGLGVLGMVMTLAIMNPYLVSIFNRSSYLCCSGKDHHPPNLVNDLEEDNGKSFKTAYQFFFMGGFFELFVLIYLCLLQVFGNAMFNWSIFLACAHIPANVSGAILVVATLLVSYRRMVGRTTLDKELWKIIHVVQYIFVSFAMVSVVGTIGFSALGWGPQYNVTDNSLVPTIGFIMGILGLAVVFLGVGPNIILYYMIGKRFAS